MKKSLIALAALATVATAAQAQSNVTIYGVVDTGYGHVNNARSNGKSDGSGNKTGSLSGLANGGLSTSRLGFRGTEDLGGGLKANFILEAEFLADNGSQASTPEALFARESSVGLAGNFGEVKLGRFNTFGYGLLAKFDAFGGNNIGGAVATGNRLGRIENAVQYLTPKFDGFQVGVQTGIRTQKTSYAALSTEYGEVAGETDGNRANSILASYDAGALELAYIFHEQNDNQGKKLADWQHLFARYNFGVAKAVVGYVKKNNKLAESNAGSTALTNGTTGLTATDVKSTEKLFAGVNVPVTNTFTLNGQVEQTEYKLNSGVTRKPVVYTAGANYAFSKRTTAYAIYSRVNQDNGSAQDIVDAGKFWGFAGASADVDKTAYTVGIRHTF